ncbi:MAG: chitobiase/beta-hexosaminidase C-terminal domain-containing protein [Saprospiraceae bacterium]|nr:chitobiase/beta-hexosaminidase C-terminal domain-containing protein [Saprospiraceae bacterium]
MPYNNVCRSLCLWLFFLSTSMSQLTAQQDFREETIYFLMTTRFFDGDPNNTRPTEWSSYGANSPSITDPNDVTWRGDFKGLIQKLDYIKDLGFTAIWITPVVQNRGPLDYHGYHAWDFTKVDPRLESPGATFQDLINAVHAKGMKIILDIVTNHSGRFGIKGLAEIKYNTDPNAAWYAPDNPNWQYDGLTPNPYDNKIWSRANLAKMPAPYNQNLAAYNWPSTESYVNTTDRNWFHQSGNGFAQGYDDTTNLYQRALAGDTPDLATEGNTVQNYMYNAYKTFIDMGVDGFRWDTWKHMDKQDIFKLLDRWRAIKPDLFVVGEVAQKRHELHQVQEINPHWYTWRGGVGNSASANVSVLDFYAEATFHGVFEEGGGFSGVTAASRYDHLYGDPSQLVTWLDNHDFGPNNDWNRRYGGSDENLAACMNFMFTWRGIPCVYYGTENRFKAGVYTDIHDASGISQSIDLTGRAYFGDQFANAPNHRIYKHIKKLNAIRKAIPALQKGSWSWAGNFPGNGVGYWREYGDSKVAVGLAKDGSAYFTFNNVPNGTYRDAVTGRTVNVTNGNLSFNVTSSSAGIYVLNGTGMIGENGAGFFESCPSGCADPLVVTISPASGNFTSPISVSMSATGGSGGRTIRYTTDGTTPSVSSTIYSSPFSVSTATTVKAKVWDAAGSVSDEAAQVYTFVLPKPVVTISPASGNYYDPISVTMSANTGTAPYTIYYTTDGSTPSVSSPVYTSALSVSTASTIKAIAKDANNQISDVATNTYTFVVPPPTVTASPVEGNYPSYPISVSLTGNSPKPPVTLYYTTDGSTPSVSSTLYTSAFSLGSNGVAKTVKVLAVDNLGQTSITTFNYTFDPIPDIVVYFKRPTNWGTNIKIHYWNAVPTGIYANTTWPGVAMTNICGDWYKFTFSGITSTNLIFNDGSGNQTADLSRSISGYYDNGWLTSTPTLTGNPSVSVTPAGPQTSTSAIAVSIAASACSGNATIYYTTDGSTPTTSSTSAINTLNLNFAQTTTLKLFARDVSGNQSAVQTHTYTINQAGQGFWVYFRKPAAWSGTPKVYYWNTLPAGSMPTVTWSGVTMTADCNGLYKFQFTNTTSTNLIFNNGNSGTSNQTADLYRTSTGLFDYTTSTWTDGNPCPIPVELIDFQGIYNLQLKQVELSWQTASEVDNKGFFVEKQYFNQWQTLGFAPAIGKAAQYGFVDKTPASLNYYRLRQVDFSGDETLSKVIAIQKSGASKLKIYPTIVADGILNMENTDNTVQRTPFGEGGIFSILNLLGQQVQMGKMAAQIDVSSLPQGTYIFKYGAEQAKFLKQ